MKKIHLYTDGACSGNPGKGGWCALLQLIDQDNHTVLSSKKFSGGLLQTTNNQMELQAVISGLSVIKEPCHITIFTDSKYVLQGMTEWIDGWKKNNWKNSQKKPVKNQELWEELDQYVNQSHHQIQWQWVKAHNGHIYNEEVDELARMAIQTL
jgi:ribonuclease HI